MECDCLRFFYLYFIFVKADGFFFIGSSCCRKLENKMLEDMSQLYMLPSVVT